MNKCRFVLDTAAFRTQVLQSDGMLKLAEQKAKEKAGANTHLKPFIGFDRAKTIIYPNSKEHPS